MTYHSRFRRLWALAWCCGLLCFATTAGLANPVSKLVSETMEYLGKNFAREVAEQGTETVAKRLETLSARHGEAVVTAATRRVGPRALRIAEEAGENALPALTTLSKYGDNALAVVTDSTQLRLVANLGDNAAAALVKHGNAATPVISKFGGEAAEALAKLSSQEGRQLAIMASEGTLAIIPQSPAVLRVIGKYGDRAMNFVWRNKLTLASVAACAAFVSNPEPFLDGAKDLSVVVAENAIKPLAQVPAELAKEAGKSTEWTIVIVTGLVLFTGYGAWRYWLRQVVEDNKMRYQSPERGKH
ncbi:MAG: hypothetical protein SFX18_14775 [Pirellulales bacterium]|nr:hypothetical protein [Pirellulales bacterium]